MIVKATREGRVGHITASGYVIDLLTPFVALPSHKALHKKVWIKNTLTNTIILATVLDVGPWNTHDDEYVFGGMRPAAERGISVSGQGTNGSGIDLGEKVWTQLQMKDNGEIEWKFV